MRYILKTLYELPYHDISIYVVYLPTIDQLAMAQCLIVWSCAGERRRSCLEEGFQF